MHAVLLEGVGNIEAQRLAQQKSTGVESSGQLKVAPHTSQNQSFCL